MILDLTKDDAVIVRQAITLHDTLLDAVTKQLVRLALPTLLVNIEQGNVQRIRALLDANTKGLELGDGAVSVGPTFGATLNTSLVLLLDKLEKLMAAEADLFAPTDGTAARIEAVALVRDRVRGQGTLFPRLHAEHADSDGVVMDAPVSASVETVEVVATTGAGARAERARMTQDASNAPETSSDAPPASEPRTASASARVETRPTSRKSSNLTNTSNARVETRPTSRKSSNLTNTSKKHDVASLVAEGVEAVRAKATARAAKLTPAPKAKATRTTKGTPRPLKGASA